MSSAWISPMKIWHWIMLVKKLSTDCLISDNNFQLLTYPSKPKPFDELNQIIGSLSIICMDTFGVWSSPFSTYLYIRFQFWHLYDSYLSAVTTFNRANPSVICSICNYDFDQIHEIYQVLPYSVDFKAPQELWNPLNKTLLSKYSFIWNKGPINIWNDHKAQK